VNKKDRRRTLLKTKRMRRSVWLTLDTFPDRQHAINKLLTEHEYEVIIIVTLTFKFVNIDVNM